jgi:hypothetical protein
VIDSSSSREPRATSGGFLRIGASGCHAR